MKVAYTGSKERLKWVKDHEVSHTIKRSLLRKTVDGKRYQCVVPSCVDLDDGVLNNFDCSCADMNSFLPEEECTGARNDDDFNGTKLCCICGGGSTQVALNGIDDHLPINISIEELTDTKSYYGCLQGSLSVQGKTKCIERFTRIPRHFYENEIQRFAQLCMLPDSDLCSNIIQRKAWSHKTMMHWLSTMTTETMAVPVIARMTGITSLNQLNDPLDICEKTVSIFCPKLFAAPAKIWQDIRKDTCSHESSKMSTYLDGDAVETVEYQASERYNNVTDGVISVLFQCFLFLIIFLWTLASVKEFESIIKWWNILLSLKQRAHEDREVEEQSDSEARTTATIEDSHRLMSIGFNLVPRTVLQCFIFYVGVRFLLAVHDISDLILNSLALTFLVSVDDMLFEAFAGEEIKDKIDEMEVIAIKDCHFSHALSLIKATQIPVGVLIFIPTMVAATFLIGDDFKQANRTAAALNCLCNIEGQGCLAAKALRAPSS